MRSIRVAARIASAVCTLCLLQASVPTARGDQDDRGIAEAISTSDHARLRAILTADPGIAQTDLLVHGRRIPPLCFAALKGSSESVELLLSAGADIENSVDARSSLFLAAQEGNVSVVSRLLEHGARPSVVDKRGRTPLHAAAMLGRTEVARALIRARAGVSPTDVLGRTPTFWAAAGGYTDIVQALRTVDRVAWRVPDRFGVSPLHVAIARSHVEAARVLLAGISVSPHDTSEGWLALCRPSLSGKTPLHIASYMCEPDLAERLMRSGLRSDTADGRGWTSERFAEQGRRAQLLRALTRRALPDETHSAPTQGTELRPPSSDTVLAEIACYGPNGMITRGSALYVRLNDSGAISFVLPCGLTPIRKDFATIDNRAVLVQEIRETGILDVAMTSVRSPDLGYVRVELNLDGLHRSIEWTAGLDRGRWIDATDRIEMDLAVERFLELLNRLPDLLAGQ